MGLADNMFPEHVRSYTSIRKRQRLRKMGNRVKQARCKAKYPSGQQAYERLSNFLMVMEVEFKITIKYQNG